LPHTAPFGFRPQRPFTPHTAGGRQSASEVHVNLQASLPQRYGKQGEVVGVTQAPAPSQEDTAVNRLDVVGHVAGLHSVPEGHFWHAPASHLPLVLHVDGS